jgi:hypothetical protein
MTPCSQALLVTTILLSGRCGGDPGANVTNEPEASVIESPAEPEPAAEITTPGPKDDPAPEPQVPPPMYISQVLGMSRQMVETLFTPVEPPDPDGWVRYNDDLLMRYENDAVVEVLQKVTAGLTCIDAAKWMGFAETMSPIYKSDGCVWPQDSIKHLLGEGFSGYLDLTTGGFTATLTAQRP